MKPTMRSVDFKSQTVTMSELKQNQSQLSLVNKSGYNTANALEFSKGNHPGNLSTTLASSLVNQEDGLTKAIKSRKLNSGLSSIQVKGSSNGALVTLK